MPADAATPRAVLGDASAWGISEHLLALIVDVLALANWQRGGRGAKPKPLPRPGVIDHDVTRIGGKGRKYTLEEMREKIAIWHGKANSVEDVGANGGRGRNGLPVDSPEP